MATGVMNDLNVKSKSFIAGGTIAANRLVKLDTTEGQVIATAAITDQVIGVNLVAAASGDQVTIQMFGVAKVTAQEAITLGAEIMPDGAGAGKAAPAAGATAISCGIALQASAADNEVIEVLLRPMVKAPANS